MPRSCSPDDPLVFGDELVEQEQHRGRRVDRHRRRDLVERNLLEQQLHVGNRVDRDPGAPDFARSARIVGVVAELRRQVEGDGKPGLAALEQVAEALVRLFRRREPGVLPDRPGPPAVHVRVRPTRERELPRRLDVGRRIVSRVERLDLDVRVGATLVAGGGHTAIVRGLRARYL